MVTEPNHIDTKRYCEGKEGTYEEIEIKENIEMIIRSHGVAKKIYDEARDRGIEIVDTTCPFVKKIHDIM